MDERGKRESREIIKFTVAVVQVEKRGWCLDWDRGHGSGWMAGKYISPEANLVSSTVVWITQL